MNYYYVVDVSIANAEIKAMRFVTLRSYFEILPRSTYVHSCNEIQILDICRHPIRCYHVFYM